MLSLRTAPPPPTRLPECRDLSRPPRSLSYFPPSRAGPPRLRTDRRLTSWASWEPRVPCAVRRLEAKELSPLPCPRPSWGMSGGGEAQGKSCLRMTLQPGSWGALWEGPVPPGREPTVPGRHPGVSSEPTGPQAESSLWELCFQTGWDPGIHTCINEPPT